MAQKVLILVKTGIFYEFSKWRKIEIQKPITEPQKLPKRNGSSVVRDVKPGLRLRSPTQRSELPHKRGGTLRDVTTRVINACEGRNNA